MLSKKAYKTFLVIITKRKYLYPCRTQKSSSLVPKILVGYPAGKIGNRQFFFIIYSSLAQLVDFETVGTIVTYSVIMRNEV